jgi:hypothetical protein
MGEGTLTRAGDGSIIFHTTTGKKLVIQRGIPQDIYAQAAATRAPVLTDVDEEIEDEEVTTTPGDIAQTPLPSATQRRKRRGLRAHPLLYLGVGMILMLALWVLGQMVVTWVGHKLDDFTYGMPRTYQTDFVVGHNNDSPGNPSHFIFLNLNGHVEVIEQPAGDAGKAKIYYGPTLYSDDAILIPVTGEFKDVNNDRKPDMIIKIQNSRIVFINENGTFRPLKPGEHITLPKD